MKRNILPVVLLMGALFTNEFVNAQVNSDSAWENTRKNIIRYNLSSALFFGFDKSIVFGYERLLKRNQSISVNFGKTGLPTLATIATDSFQASKDSKNSGLNASIDYRFYLGKLNRYGAPRGVYIGPFYSFNKINRDSEWNSVVGSNTPRMITTESKLNFSTLGVELGYQFIFWNRLSVDMVLIGPGVGWYKFQAKADGNLTNEERQQLQEAVRDILTQKFPGMNYVFSDKQLDGSGAVNITSVGFRYLIQIGFNF